MIDLIITGDSFPGGGRTKELAVNGEAEKLFGPFYNKLKKADLSITNLESPVTNSNQKISKTGPNIKSSPDTLPVFKESGINLVTLANNHILDYGETGLSDTLKACQELSINTVGAGKNLDEAVTPFFFNKNGVKVAIINIAENEFGTTSDESAGANPLDIVQNFYKIQKTREVADHVFVIIHGGHEHYPLPSPRMKETYRFFIDAGVSAVIGHHPHCYSGYEVYKNAPIFYSLGNFLFDKEKRYTNYWNEGFAVRFSVSKESIEFNLIPYIQSGENAGIRKLSNDEFIIFESKLNELNKIISNDSELNKKFEQFCKSSSNLYRAYIEPHNFRFLHALQNRNFFPRLLSNRKRRLLLNLTRCEAHRDVLLNILSE